MKTVNYPLTHSLKSRDASASKNTNTCPKVITHVDIDFRTKVVLNAPTTRTTAHPSSREYYDSDYDEDLVEVGRIIELA